MPTITRLEDIPGKWATVRPDAVALVDTSGPFNWSQLEAARTSLAAQLHSLGVRPGDRVMIVGENCATLVALLFAVATLDAWMVIVNARLSAREVDVIRDHCGACCAVYLPDGSTDALMHATRHEAVPMTTPSDWGTILRSPLDASCAPEAAAGAPRDRVAALVYTTGTTGEPKGVMLTHANLLFVAKAAVQLRALTADDHILGVLPLAHVYGLSSVCLASLLAGACIHLKPRFTPEAMQSALEVDRVTVCQGVPAMYSKYVEFLAATGRKINAPRLRAIYCGGSPLTASVKSAVESVFSLTLHNGYGLTEAAPTVTQTRHEAPRGDCSVGPALPGVELRIARKGGGNAAPGEVGELWVRGPNVMRGYYRDERASREALPHAGWLATGDLARIDPDSAVHIEGRLKELIIRSGFNVYPAEVEAVLNAHPEVSQSAVVGRDVEGNEEVVAFVELVAGARVAAPDLLAFAAAGLAPYKRPAEVVVMARLPAAPSGKVLKGRLKEMARASARPAAPGR